MTTIQSATCLACLLFVASMGLCGTYALGRRHERTELERDELYDFNLEAHAWLDEDDGDDGIKTLDGGLTL